MPRADKSKYTGKQERKADRIALTLLRADQVAPTLFSIQEIEREARKHAIAEATLTGMYQR